MAAPHATPRSVRPVLIALLALVVALAALAGAAALAAAPASALTAEDYGFISAIGPAYGPSLSWSGSGPDAIDIDPAGNIYVSNPWGFAKFDASGAFVCSYDGSTGLFGGGYFGLAVADGGIVILTEGNADRIVTALPVSDGVNASAYTPGPEFGSAGSGDGQFGWPKGVAVDDTDVYVCEQNNSRIQKLSLDPDTGQLSYLAKFGKNGGDGSTGFGDGEFTNPTGIAADGHGHIYVVESTRVQELTTDGVFVSKFGAFGQPNAELYLYSALDADVDTAGDLYVTDFGPEGTTSWVNKYRKVDGAWHRVTRFGGWGDADEQFKFPWGVAVDPMGCLYVTDTQNNKVKKFGRDAIAPMLWAFGVPPSWTDQDVTVELTGQDWDLIPGLYVSGLDRIEYSLADAQPPWTTYTAPFIISTEGTTLVTLRAVDKAGNSSLPGMLGVRIDKTAPVTAVSGVPSSWSRTVKVALTPSDPFSGAVATQYRLLGATDWIDYTAAFTPRQGKSVYEFRSSDATGNDETPQVVTVRYDTGRPVPKALADVSVLRGRTARLRYRVNDICPQAKVTIRIYKGTKLVRKLSLGTRTTNKDLTYSYTCSLARGRYTWKVYAADLAGNLQAKPGARHLTVK